MLRRIALPWLVSATMVLGALLLLCHNGIENASARAVRPCAHPVLLRAGQAVAPWRLGAIDMLNTRIGVAVTLARVDCARRIRGGEEIGPVAQTIRLAVTRDGGAHWRTEGTPQPLDHPAFHDGFQLEQLAAASPQRVWLLASDGVAFATSDGGARWTRLALPLPAVSLALTAHSVWVLSCPRQSRPAQSPFCTPRLERIDRAGGRVTSHALPGEGPTSQPMLVASADGSLVVDEATGVSPHPLLVSTDAGRRWVRRSLPRWQGHPCAFPADLSVLNRDWWFMCIGGAAAGSSTKALFHTTDAGRHWTLRSAVDSLIDPHPPGEITVAEPAALAAASAHRLWLATFNGLQTSDTAGRSWRGVRGINQQGDPSVFDVLSDRQAWLLSPGAALWRTTDGKRWVRLGSRGPG